MTTSPKAGRNPKSRKQPSESHAEPFASLYVVEATPPAGTGPFFWSVGWDNPVKPGQYMRYRSTVDNNGPSQGAQMTITTWVGPGCLFTDAVESLLARDTGWPMLGSQMFCVKPGERVAVDMGHRLPAAVVPGFYVINLLLWELNNYNRPARIWDRMHLRFEVRE